MSAEPSASTVMRSPPPGPPTMRSIRPANVTRPAVPPNSSITIAMPESAAVHLGQQIVGGQRLRHRERLAHDAGQIGRRLAAGDQVEEVRDAEDADDVVDALAVDGQPRVPAARGDLGDLGGRRVHRQRHHLGARHHDLSRGQIGEREDAVQHLLLFFLEHPGFLRGRHQHLQLFFRVHE